MKNKSTVLLVALVAIAIYPLSYLIVSHNGFYEPVLLGAMKGHNGETILAPKGFGYFWMPFEKSYPMKRNDGRLSILACFYRPLILIDRAVWHTNDKVHTLRYRTKNYYDPETCLSHDIK